MASAHLKEIIPLSIDAEGWSAVEGEDGMFSHPITHEKITATSYLTLNPGSDTLLSAFSEIGYAGGYIKNDGGNVNWFIKAGQKPSSPFSVQLTLEQAKEGSGPIYTSLNTGGGSGGGFVVSDTQPEKNNLLWIQPNGLTKFWNGSEWTAIAGVYAEEVE